MVGDDVNKGVSMLRADDCDEGTVVTLDQGAGWAQVAWADSVP